MIPLLALIIATPRVNYLTVDIRTREVIERNWDDAETPVPVGSLVKPLLALAYPGDWPEFFCTGRRCWLTRGHGKLQFRDALAQSCNEYFLNLARGVDAETLAVVARKFAIPTPESSSAEARIGLGTAWKISPLALARAYAELASRAGEPRVAEILGGLRMAAQSGTARAIGAGRMAKTGTAPCAALKRDAGDGFALVFDPADAPRVVLLLRVHAATGAVAAQVAARKLAGNVAR
jgi:cell division protein FtsI/penicillin-binding protein 2